MLTRSVSELRELPAQLWERYAEKLDIWSLSSFRGQTQREKAWNVGVRVLPCLDWLQRYDVKRQLLRDIAAGACGGAGAARAGAVLGSVSRVRQLA